MMAAKFRRVKLPGSHNQRNSWQHAGFGDPVLFAPGRMQATSDQFWLRFQVYF
jgi:hypothetical protein